MRSLDERLVRKILLAQVVMTLMLAAGLMIPGPVYAWSGLIGGTIAAIANGVFAFWVFRPYRAQHTGILLSRFYGAELLKMAIVAVAFLGTFLWVEPLSAGALLGCFMAVYLVPAAVAAFRPGASQKG
jgi:ATP synthase protein I